MIEFKKKASETLDDIFNLVESKFDNYEVDYEDENLRIDSLEGKGTFIVKHSHTDISDLVIFSCKWCPSF